MKISKPNKYFIVFQLIYIIFCSNGVFAQLGSPFKKRYQGNVKGDMTLIANNIVNRSETKQNANSPYNEIDEKAKLNDEFEMVYIDVDNDESTFSSSAASLSLSNISEKKIVYAGLYWAGTYKYDSGIRDKNWKYLAVNNSREIINEIKFKLPGKKEYINITGEVLFDGLAHKNFKESAPYSVYADVTSHLQGLSNPNGEYMVANIRATQGIISGGVAAGWTLFIVYEEASASEKFITSFDGFVGITTKPIEIAYTGFNTLPKGNVNAKLAFAALEGDRNLTGDQLELKDGNSAKYTLVSHPLKPVDNFFNSTIVLDDNYFSTRNPNSLNTLGYDAGMFTIDNKNNSIIQNNTSKVSMRLKSSGDRYAMFFSAFNVEVTSPVEESVPVIVEAKPIETETALKREEILQTIKDSESTNVAKTNDENMSQKSVMEEAISQVEQPKTEIKTEKTAEIIPQSTIQQAVSTPEKVVVATPSTEPKRKYNSIMDMIRDSEKMNAETTSSKKRITVLPGADVIIPQQAKGYYVVANVFAVPKNATRFLDKLKKNGFENAD
uniref:hypothetical protein n=1 Tax=Flavobacterium filum TaxID=370974 RepID=UPI0023F2EDC5